MPKQLNPYCFLLQPDYDYLLAYQVLYYLFSLMGHQQWLLFWWLCLLTEFIWVEEKVPIVSEDDDSDIIGLQVESHTSDSWSELDHLSGLDFVEADHSGDTVTDTKHSSELFNIILNKFYSTTWLMFMIFSWITLEV